MKKLVGVLAMGTVTVIYAPSASADDIVSTDDTAHPTESTPAFAASRMSLTLQAWPAADHFALLIGDELSVRVASQVFLDLSYAGAFATARDTDTRADGGLQQASFRFGAPTIGAHFVGAATPSFHYFLGGSVTYPFLQDPTARESRAGFLGAQIDDYYGADRFARGHFAVRMTSGLEWHAAESLFVRAELRPVIYAPVDSAARSDAASSAAFAPEKRTGASFLLEHAIELEARSSTGFGVGARLQGVATPMEVDPEHVLVEPFVAYTPARAGVTARIGAPVALDRDLGFGMDRNKLAAVKVVLGGQW
ncbi:MAG: hypothetical protein U0441_03050 [Polyangiaceae bacterium]